MKKLCRSLLGLMFAVSVSGPATAEETNAQRKDQASKIAVPWLELVDSARYDESWTQAATLFRSGVPKQQWQAAAKAAREPLGKLKSRTLKTAEYATELPGVPDGQYVVLQFETAFENKTHATETVTPMLDTDGKWRVSGYYIK